jgi:hypothetical protein
MSELGQPRLAKNGVSRAGFLNVEGNNEVASRHRAKPDFVASFPVSHEDTSGIAKAPDQFAI